MAALLPAPANASRYVRYGVQDDAWLRYGPGTLDQRVARLRSIGVDRPYRPQQRRLGRWQWVGSTRHTDARGFFKRTVRAQPGTRLRVWSPRSKSFSFPVTLRLDA